MKEAYDRSRVTPLGKELGNNIVRMTERSIAKLIEEDEPDDRCNACAFRAGTVPNGCEQTLMDAIKCVAEGVPFLCHNDSTKETVCHGYYAARVALDGKTWEAPWSFLKSDEEEV